MKELYASGHKHPMLGRSHTEEAKEKVRQARLGTHVSEYVKQRVRESQTGRIVSDKTKEKNRLARINKKVSEVTRLNMKEAAKKRWEDKEYKRIQIIKRIGKNNPNYRGGIQYEPYDNNWTRNFKNSIRKRDNQVCMNCGIHRERLYYSLEIHHIDYNKTHSVKDNCISLCKSCHSLTQTNRRYWTEFFYAKLSHLYGYQYTESFQIVNLIDVMKGGTINKDVNKIKKIVEGK
jgi:hypothetical protein